MQALLKHTSEQSVPARDRVWGHALHEKFTTAGAILGPSQCASSSAQGSVTRPWLPTTLAAGRVLRMTFLNMVLAGWA